MSESYEILIAAVQSAMQYMIDEQRIEFLNTIMEPYCKHCGTTNPDCRCWDDD